MADFFNGLSHTSTLRIDNDLALDRWRARLLLSRSCSECVLLLSFRFSTRRRLCSFLGSLASGPTSCCYTSETLSGDRLLRKSTYSSLHATCAELEVFFFLGQLGAPLYIYQ